jgi:hypothetical protein
VTYSHQHTIFVEPISYRDAAIKLNKTKSANNIEQPTGAPLG